MGMGIFDFALKHKYSSPTKPRSHWNG